MAQYAPANGSYEIIVANNGCHPNAVERIEAIINRFDRIEGVPIRRVREPKPGKCRAQNFAIQNSVVNIVVFLTMMSS